MLRGLFVLVTACSLMACGTRAPNVDIVVASAPHLAQRVDSCGDLRVEEKIDAETGALEARFFCAPTPAGAWAVRIDAPKDGATDLELVTIHAGLGGERLRQTATMAGAARWWPTIAPLARGATVFDFDGDGEPELFLKVSRIGFTEYSVQRVFVTAKGGAIIGYAPAAALASSIEGFEDVDGDGRPDARLGARRYAHAKDDGSFWVEKAPTSPATSKLEATLR